MKTRIDTLETRVTHVEIQVSSMGERTASAHRRIDEEKAEVDLLRVRTHGHANEIQKHGGILIGMESAVKELVDATKQNTQAVFAFRIMALTAMIMGSAFVSFCGFVGGKLLNWW